MVQVSLKFYTSYRTVNTSPPHAIIARLSVDPVCVLLRLAHSVGLGCRCTDLESPILLGCFVLGGFGWAQSVVFDPSHEVSFLHKLQHSFCVSTVGGRVLIVASIPLFVGYTKWCS